MVVRKEVRHIDFDLGNLADPMSVGGDGNGDSSDYYRDMASERKQLSRGNIASFYSHLFQAVSGGTVTDKFRKKIRLLNGQERIYSPDVKVENTDGVTDVEVKSFSTRQGRAICSTGQFETYCSNLLKSYDSLDMEGLDVSGAGFKYAFFRFKVLQPVKKVRGKKFSNGNPKYRRDPTSWKPQKMNPADLIFALSAGVKDLLVVPPNLAMLLFVGSYLSEHDQSNHGGSKDKRYWYVPSGDITRLHNFSNEGIHSLVKQNNKYQLEGYPPGYLGSLPLSRWGLDSLVANQYESSVIKVNGHFTVNPFKVTSYDFADKESQLKWIEYFRKYHRAFLEKSLDIRDIYGEEKRRAKRRKPYDGIPI